MNVLTHLSFKILRLVLFGSTLKQLYYKKFGFRLEQENAITMYIYFAYSLMFYLTSYQLLLLLLLILGVLKNTFSNVKDVHG